MMGLFRSLVFAACGICVIDGFVTAELCQKSGRVLIEAIIFSGSRNPTFKLSGQRRARFCELLLPANSTVPSPSCRVLGFIGWRACFASGFDSDCRMYRGEPKLDQFLVESLTMEHQDLPASVMKHVFEELRHLESGGDPACIEEDPLLPFPAANCSGPILGPDDPKAVHYSPGSDDSGCFVKNQGENNCYDYGNDIVTNTFAQPGRGSGVCPPDARPCVNNTCDEVKRAAVSDGLTWIGATLPTALPENGHYVSLHIWPDTNFHWLRMDADKSWSHKPGGSSVRNFDNKRNRIEDPAQADLSPWTQHCGYMLSVPSKARIHLAEMPIAYMPVVV